ncbi:FMN-dependent dehydrogenase-domain-containing protein [Fomitopsis serialis]|uniref:FMN-dependent dehydrogenase-domain-containing protein n=1 Tax=Fomitopsis serialis TaxID=139415 RepID=UPI00200815F2|nr:FMN-dependent dehydrogenase-domain-containing protein [Neoantrodia serialis]KAH9937552.1 FMN-dependent dehydrogenase-domain-containing protein [Neoantrodia serialis]
MARVWSLQEVAEHNNASSCWVIISNKVYDVTEFLPEHPGGSKIILKYAGRDATKAYEPIHPKDALDKHLPQEKHLGPLDSTGAKELQATLATQPKTQDEIRVEKARARKRPINQILSLQDMEDVAREVLPYKAWAFYRSAGDDEITYNENRRAFSRFFFHPRILRPISKIDTSTTILGFDSSLPIFVSAASLGKLGHPLGEANITHGCGRMGIIQMVSHYASVSRPELMAARVNESQPLFFQLYPDRDKSVSAKAIREVEELGFNAMFMTVDGPVNGNRERDLRAPFDLEEQERIVEEAKKASGKPGESGELPERPEDADNKLVDGELVLVGTSGGLRTTAELDMSWTDTLPWLQRTTKLPIVLKGIQCVDDAVRAAEAGVHGILLSNHGVVLYRIRKQRPDVFDKLEVYIDGGVHRGTDVLKALCLGARAVGLGRAFHFANSAYGEAGVIQTIRILQREIILGMRLLGVTSVQGLTPNLVERVDWQPLLAKM